MPDDEHPIEGEVRRRQDDALSTLGGLQTALTTLVEELSKRPTDDQLKEALAYNRKRGLTGLRIGGFVIILLIVLTGVPLVVNSFANRSNSQTIKECTTPGEKKPTLQDPLDTGHECFDKGQQRTANILVRAAQNEVIILTCYRDKEGNLRPQDVFVQCVNDRLGVRTTG